MLRLTWSRVGLLAIAWAASVVGHNLVYGLLYERLPPGWDEPVLFTLAVTVLPAYLLVSGLYTLVAMLRDARRVRGLR